jgi:hypothetical protein
VPIDTGVELVQKPVKFGDRVLGKVEGMAGDFNATGGALLLARRDRPDHVCKLLADALIGDAVIRANQLQRLALRGRILLKINGLGRASLQGAGTLLCYVVADLVEEVSERDAEDAGEIKEPA